MHKHRPDITGLRAVAILAVILFHVGTPGFEGGFVGVDVFFVISGYLITGKILRELDEGRFSVGRFYIGRLRRLGPALLSTVAVTLVFGVLLLSPAHLADLARSSIAATFWSSNVFFWTEVGYWDLESGLKPLLHTWSLGVEEQFYLVWPALLVAVSAAKRRWLVAASLAVVGTLSLYGTEIWTETDPSGAFYLPMFRCWEFAIGGLVLFAERAGPRRDVILEGLAAAGLGLVLYPVLAFSEATRFPGWSAMLPCMGTALMIYAGEVRLTPALWRNRVARWIGRRGYSLYLVHWPLVVLYQYWRFEPITGLERAGLVAATFALTEPLYRRVEQRYRYPRENAGWRSELRFAGMLLTLALLVTGPALAMSLQGGWEWRVSSHPSAAVMAEFRHPCIDGLGLCPDGKDAVLVGDSHAGHFAPAIAATLRRLKLSGVPYRRVNNCKLLIGAYFGYSIEDREHNECRRAVREWVESISRDDPRIVFMAGFWPSGISTAVSGRLLSDRMQKRPTLEESRALFERQLAATIDWLTSAGRRVVILGSTPLLVTSPAGCYSRPKLLGRIDCRSLNHLADLDTNTYLERVFRKVARHNARVFYFDTFAALCPQRHCLLGENGVSFHRDRHHLTAYGAMWLRYHHFGDLEKFLVGAVGVITDTEGRSGN